MAKTLSSYGEFLKEGERLAAALAANEADLPYLADPRSQLEALLTQARELIVQQSTLTASKQEATRQLDSIFVNGTKLITFLRKGVLHHYGSRSEKVVEFGLLPFRGRPRQITPRPAPTTPTTPVVE